MRLPKLVLAVLILAGCLGNVAVTWLRSTIPLQLNGMVDSIELRREKRGGVDDVYLVTVDDETLQMDTVLGTTLRKGDHVRKDRWSRVLRTSRGPVPLEPSKDAKGMMATMTIIAVTLTVLLVRRN